MREMIRAAVRCFATPDATTALAHQTHFVRRADDLAVKRRRPLDRKTIAGVSDRLHLRFFLRRRSPRCDGPAFSEERERPYSGCYCRDCGAGMRSRLGDFDNLLVSVHDGGRCPAATADPV